MKENYLFTEPLNFPDSKEEKLSIIESILFASGEAVPLRDLKRVLGIFSDELDELIETLDQKYQSQESGLSLSVSEESVQLSSKALNFKYVQSALGLNKRRNLSKAANEVLAILAYNQPLTRVEIDKIRGVNSSGSIQKLIDLGLVEECGKKEVPGRPFLYKTTDLFLHTIGIKNLEELPSFDDFRKEANIE